MTENDWRLAVALGVFLLMIVWEGFCPRRPNPQRRRRWPINLGLALTNMAVMRLTLGALAVAGARWAEAQGVGLLSQVSWPGALEALLAWLLLDLAIYGQHIAAHRWPWLWRLHRVHHSDLMFDASTAVRFHPLEILLSMGYKGICVVALGAAPWVVMAFEILLNAAATFNHGNVRLPGRVEKILRYLVITPDLHRLHHSTHIPEMNSNYGFSLSVWDRLFGTLTETARTPQTVMPIGLPAPRDPARLTFLKLLILPWRRC